MKSFRKWQLILVPAIVLAGVIGYVAYRTRRIPTPARRWKRFDHPETLPLTATACNALQGIYSIEAGMDFFGNTAVLKYSYTIEKEKTVHNLSLFCEKNGTYLLCEGRQHGDDILLKGHWRKAAAGGTGLAWLVVENGLNLLAKAGSSPSITLTGNFGDDSEKPAKKLTFRYQRPLPAVPSFDIIAHRGGARNVDFLSISENTTEMIKLAAQLGATGIEIDIRMTKDNVPVVFHDSFFSIHTVQGMIYGGLLHNHTLEEVQRLELRNYGQIPTLREMLETVLYQTPLEIVWLDIKKECDLEMIRSLQNEFHQKAVAMDRKLTIYIGIPDSYLLSCFKKLDDHHDIPSLVELDCKTAIDINAQVWAPQYTGGFQADEVATVQAAKKKAYVWSLDDAFLIDKYVSEGGFDGLVTNASPVVAYWYYTKGYKLKEKQRKPERQT